MILIGRMRRKQPPGAKEQGLWVMSRETQVVKFRMTALAAQQRIRELAKETNRVLLSLHAKDQMAARDIYIQDVYRVLRTGNVDEDPVKGEGSDWKCKITARIRGRRDVGVITAIMENSKLKVITVEWEDLI